MDAANRNHAVDKERNVDSRLFIAVPQLQEIIAQLGLGLTSKEIQVLASGFASDGKGGIDSEEFCEMIRSLVYNLMGSHFRDGERGREGGGGERDGSGGRSGFFPSSSSSSRLNRRGNESSHFSREKERDFLDEFHRLLRECCDSIVLYDR
jgi:hypothetical protein